MKTIFRILAIFCILIGTTAGVVAALFLNELPARIVVLSLNISIGWLFAIIFFVIARKC